ncbi:MAG: hypothetical protein KDB07_13305, partial [Planctomycetes bacterium]|nr:hypothetical protein [Planctomycetota bacterium]
GNPRKARSVSDRVIGPPYLKDSEFVLALNQAGIIPTKGTSRALLELSRDSISSGRSAASALLGNASATMLYLSDTSKALEASFVYAQVPPSETFPIPNTSLAVNTRQLFVENLHYELQNQRNAVIPFVALHENLFDLPRLGDFTPPISPREGAMTFYGVPDRVRYWQNLNEASGYSLVIATASRDEHTRERIATAYRNEIEALTGPDRETYIDQILSLFYMESLTSAGLDVGSVLIIDLAQGASDAAILASAISQVLTQKGLSDSVVLWDPQSEAGN